MDEKTEMISFVMPTYNRGALLTAHVEQFIAFLKTNDLAFELILVDDGSVDETEAAVQHLANTYPEICGIVLDRNYGQQNATLAGMRRAKAEYVMTVDDDLEYDLGAVLKILEGLKSGYDVVYVTDIGSDRKKIRQWGTRLKEWSFFIFCGKPQDVQLTSYRGMNRLVVDYIAKDDIKSVYISARILQLKPKIGQVKTESSAPQHIQSNYNGLRLILLLLRTVFNYGKGWAFEPFRSRGIQYRIKEVFE